MASTFYQAWDYVLLAFGFGFVVFFHELGHFLAAKYSDVKVEQFAVGFGNAIFSWRKGLGFRRGSSGAEYQRILDSNQDGAQGKAASTIGETEYRLNWIPLGGYVKMLGQDDMKPGVTAEDPRAYNNKSIGARMLIVSAGVVMNVILAAIGFMILFLTGYPAPPAEVGGVISNSPAAHATNASGVRVGLQLGDKIISYNGNSTIGDFTKILLNVALTDEGESVPVLVEHRDKTQETLHVTPRYPNGETNSLLQMGVMQPPELAAPPPSVMDDWDPVKMKATKLPGALALAPGDAITQIDGKDVKPDEFWKLNEALLAADGKPVDLTVQSIDGKISHAWAHPLLVTRFDGEETNFAGMEIRAIVAGLVNKSPAMGLLKPGDVILAVDDGTDHLSNPTGKQVRDAFSAAGEKSDQVTITVQGPDDANPRVIKDIVPSLRVDVDRKGMGIELGSDAGHAVIAQTRPGSSAAAAKIPTGATLTAIDGQAVDNWFQVRRIIAAAKPGETVSVTYILPEPAARPTVTSLKLSAADVESAQMTTITGDLLLRPMPGVLKTSNPLVALKWGVMETRDLILQFYLTLQRMATGRLSLNNVMGPVGMVQAGAQFASEGMGWLLWFLANISANLAVVNFLPIPIVDGGLFVFLILEKIQGKPLSMEVQRIVQMVGLALLALCVFMLTYHDIARWAGYAH